MRNFFNYFAHLETSFRSEPICQKSFSSKASKYRGLRLQCSLVFQHQSSLFLPSKLSLHLLSIFKVGHCSMEVRCLSSDTVHNTLHFGYPALLFVDQEQDVAVTTVPQYIRCWHTLLLRTLWSAIRVACGNKVRHSVKAKGSCCRLGIFSSRELPQTGLPLHWHLYGVKMAQSGDIQVGFIPRMKIHPTFHASHVRWVTVCQILDPELIH